MPSNPTAAQVEAARENGALSHGPNDTSNTRYNAVKHGILADVVYCKDENEEYEFEALLAGVMEEWDPQTQNEVFYTERIAQCMWRFRLIELRFCKNPGMGNEDLVLHGRYERHVSRELHEAEDKLTALQAGRVARESLSDETNPSANPESRKTASQPLPEAVAAESLRRVTRIFEIIGDLSDDDRTFLRTAARSHLATVMPKLVLMPTENAA